MLGMFSVQQNRERVTKLNERIDKIERASQRRELTDAEVDELGDAREASAEINQWLTDIWRAEGGGMSEGD